MGKKGKKAAKLAGVAAKVEKMKRAFSNCGKVSSAEKNFSKCAFCELTRYCLGDCQKARWTVRLDEEPLLVQY